MRFGSLATGVIIQIPEGWTAMPADDEVVASTPVSEVVAIPEYPGYYQRLLLDERDIAQNNFATRGWWLLVARKTGEDTWDDAEAFLQISATQPGFPVDWAEEIKKTEEYKKTHPFGEPSSKTMPMWPWVVVGGGVGAVILLLSSRGKKNRRGKR